MKQKSGAQIIVKLLERQGLEIIAGIPGGSNLLLYDALEESSIRHILTRHEQGGAGFLAQGMARSTGRAAVCFATSGSGATNLITAIAETRLDSIPLIGTDAFQEVDMFGLTLPITKHNFFVEGAADLLHVIPEASGLPSQTGPARLPSISPRMCRPPWSILTNGRSQALGRRRARATRR
jgi:acetolactate synthase-1/2/3 large subunit